MSGRGLIPDNSTAVSGPRWSFVPFEVDSTTNSLSLPEAWMFSLRPVIAQNDARAGRVMSWSKDHRPDKTSLSSWVLQSRSW